MKLIDVEDIDYVILEDSLHRIEHKKGDEIDCVIGAKIVQAISLDKVKQAREEISEMRKEHNVSVADCLDVLDKLIESEEKE